MFLDVKDEAMCKISGPSVHWKRIFSFESPDRPPRSLGGHSRYLNGFFMTLDFRNDTYINIKEALCKISGPSVHWKRIFSLASPERPPRNLGGYS